VVVEVPHFASLRDGERDVMVLRSDDAVTWCEHRALASGRAVHDMLSDSFEGEGDYRSVHVASLDAATSTLVRSLDWLCLVAGDSSDPSGVCLDMDDI